MDIRELLTTLKTRSYRISGVAVSFFNLVSVILSAAFILLLLSIQFGWTFIAAILFLLAGMVVSFMGFAVNAVRSVFGTGKSIMFGAVVLYLHLMSSIAFGAPELFADLGIRKWFALTFIYFIFTTGGSALLNFQKVSQFISVLIILFTLNVFFVDNQFVRKISIIGNGIAENIESVTDRVMMKINNPEVVVKRYYEKEYAKALNDLTERLKRHEITPEVYQKSVDDLKESYRDKIDVQDEKTASGQNDQALKSSITLYDSVIATDIVDSNPAGTGTQFVSTFQKLYYFARYTGAEPSRTNFKCKWYRGNRLLYTSSKVVPYRNGNLLFLCKNVRIAGEYEVKIFAGGKLIDSVTFSVKDVTDRFSSDGERSENMQVAASDSSLPWQQGIRYSDKVYALPERFSGNSKADILIESIAVVPAKVFPGHEVRLGAQYHVFTSSPDKELKVREIRYIRRKGVNFIEPLYRYVYRKRGLVSSFAALSLPKRMPRGYYEVIIGIDDGVSLKQQNSGFHVQ